jgi:hypothetical protein
VSWGKVTPGEVPGGERSAMPLRRGRSRLLGAVLVAMALGCPRLKQDAGASDGDGDGDTASGAADAGAGRPIDELSTSELSNFCADLNERMRELFDNRELVAFECTRVYVNGGDALSCTQAVAECVRDAPEAATTAPRPPAFYIDGTECNTFGTCPVSTGVFEACIEDRFEQTDRLIARMSCGIAGDPEAIDALETELGTPRPVPPSCSEVQARCAGLL